MKWHLRLCNKWLSYPLTNAFYDRRQVGMTIWPLVTWRRRHDGERKRRGRRTRLLHLQRKPSDMCPFKLPKPIIHQPVFQISNATPHGKSGGGGTDFPPHTFRVVYKIMMWDYLFDICVYIYSEKIKVFHWCLFPLQQSLVSLWTFCFYR